MTIYFPSNDFPKVEYYTSNRHLTSYTTAERPVYSYYTSQNCFWFCLLICLLLLFLFSLVAEVVIVNTYVK